MDKSSTNHQKDTSSQKRKRLLICLCPILILIVFSACSRYENILPKPEIMVYQQDSWNEYLSGHVQGADFKLYNIAIYGNINEKWHNLPNTTSPLTPISKDGVWSCYVDVGMHDLISRLSIYLLPTGYLPPILEGEDMIPLKINLVSVAKKTIVFD